MNYKTLEVIKYAALISENSRIFSTLVFIDVNDPSITWITYTRSTDLTNLTTNMGYGYI